MFYNSFRWLRLEDRLIDCYDRMCQNTDIDVLSTPPTSTQCWPNDYFFSWRGTAIFAITRLTCNRRPDLLMNWNTFTCWLEFQTFLKQIFFYGNDCFKPKIGLLKKDSILHMIFKNVQHLNFIIGTWFFQMGFWKRCS